MHCSYHCTIDFRKKQKKMRAEWKWIIESWNLKSIDLISEIQFNLCAINMISNWLKDLTDVKSSQMYFETLISHIDYSLISHIDLIDAMDDYRNKCRRMTLKTRFIWWIGQKFVLRVASFFGSSPHVCMPSSHICKYEKMLIRQTRRKMRLNRRLQLKNYKILIGDIPFAKLNSPLQFWISGANKSWIISIGFSEAQRKAMCINGVALGDYTSLSSNVLELYVVVTQI